MNSKVATLNIAYLYQMFMSMNNQNDPLDLQVSAPVSQRRVMEVY